MLAVVGDGRSGDPLHERGMLGPEFDKGIYIKLFITKVRRYELLNTSINNFANEGMIFIS